MKRYPYRLIDHTADIGFHLRAKDYHELFQAGAWAMFDIMAHPKNVIAAEQTQRLTVTARGQDWADLLFEWLSELHSLSDSRALIFVEYHILELRPAQLTAEVLGADYSLFDFDREIKAVTYHELKIELSNNRIEAQVIFDL